MFKKFSILFLVVLLMSNMAACSPGANTDGKASSEISGKTDELKGNVRFWAFGSPQEVDELDQALNNSFYKEFPDIKINVELATGEYYQKLLTWMSGGVEPDVFFMEPGEIQAFLKDGRLESLDGYIGKSTKFTKDMIWPINYEAYSYENDSFGTGPLYSIIKDWTPDLMLCYNKKLFKEAGITDLSEKNPVTWDTFYKYMMQLTKKDNNGRITQYGLLTDSLPYKFIVQLMVNNGASWFDKEGNIKLDDPKVKKAIEFFFKLQKDSGSASYGGGMPGAELFANNQLAMYFTGRYSATSSKWIENGIDVGVAPPPVPEAGMKSIALTTGLVGFAISSKSSKKDESWAFIEWYMTNYSIETAKTGFNIPGNKKIADEYFLNNVKDPKVLKINQDFYNAGNTITSIIPRNPLCPAMDFEKIMGNYGGGYVQDKISYPDFIRNVTNELNAVVESNR